MGSQRVVLTYYFFLLSKMVECFLEITSFFQEHIVNTVYERTVYTCISWYLLRAFVSETLHISIPSLISF